jgi:hypothetical protein
MQNHRILSHSFEDTENERCQPPVPQFDSVIPLSSGEIWLKKTEIGRDRDGYYQSSCQKWRQKVQVEGSRDGPFGSSEICGDVKRVLVKFLEFL